MMASEAAAIDAPMPRPKPRDRGLRSQAPIGGYEQASFFEPSEKKRTQMECAGRAMVGQGFTEKVL
jgi:hypothetical protein